MWVVALPRFLKAVQYFLANKYDCSTIYNSKNKLKH